MKKVIVFKNGCSSGGEMMNVMDSLDAFLKEIGKKFKIEAKILYTSQGKKVDCIHHIKDTEILYVSSGDPYLDLSCDESETQAGKKHKLQNLDDDVLEQKFCSNKDWILLNVGGKHFATTRSTLTGSYPNSMLARMIASENNTLLSPSSMDKHGAYLIDRSPRYFEPILNYLRHGRLVIDKGIDRSGVLEEAKFYGIEPLSKFLEITMRHEKNYAEGIILGRDDVVKALMSTSCTSELRFQGINLNYANLCRLDLRHINFKYTSLQFAKLRGANLSYCCLERADLSNADLEGAILHGVKMMCANLQSAKMVSCNMEDPSGKGANLEGANLRNANLEGSQMAGANLRVATLKNASLMNCDLRGAILAGADLERCDLSGSDLHEANLRGANLTDATFELMLTPLHMSQAL